MIAKDGNDETRESVKKAYTKAVERKLCCGCSEKSSKGVASKTAGYSSEELGSIPTDAAENSFGCGNPLAYSEVKEGQVVLDLGSGAGIDILLAAKKVGPKGKVIGIDMTDAMLEKARENIRKSGLKNIEVRKGIIEDLPVEDESVDWLISNCVINLSPEKEKVFKEIFRVLKPGGKISVSDLVVKDLPEWIRKNKALYNSCIAGAISEEEYIKGLEKAGLKSVEITERFVYESLQLKEFIKSEESEDPLAENEIESMAAELEGKIWSAKIKACKP